MIQPQRSRSRLSSFRHAFSGLGYVVRTQRNAWIHATITVVVILLGIWLGLERYDWTLIMIAIQAIDITCELCGSVETGFPSVALPLEQGKIGCSY